MKERHGLIRNVRNDVMHAHAMSTETYKLGVEALDEALVELDVYLGSRLKRSRSRSTFSEALKNVLAAYEASTAQVSFDAMGRLAESYIEAGPALEKSMNRLADSISIASEIDFSGLTAGVEALQKRFDEWEQALSPDVIAGERRVSSEAKGELRDNEEG